MFFTCLLLFNYWNFDVCIAIFNFGKIIFWILNGGVQISMRTLEKFSNLTNGTGRLFATEEYCAVKICSLFTFYAESSTKQKNVKTELTRRCTRVFWGDRNSKTCQPQKFLPASIFSLKVVFVVIVVVFFGFFCSLFLTSISWHWSALHCLLCWFHNTAFYSNRSEIF